MYGESGLRPKSDSIVHVQALAVDSRAAPSQSYYMTCHLVQLFLIRIRNNHMVSTAYSKRLYYTIQLL